MALTTSQKIELIKSVANHLDLEDYPVIDLTLSQFGFPVSSTWNGNKYDYLINHVQAGTENQLIDIAQHVGIALKEVGAVATFDPPFWKKSRLRVFISHLSANKFFAAELQQALDGYGISGFVAHNDIEPTLEWQNEIVAALATCHSLVALLHPNFHSSNWTDQEIGFAMGRGVPVFSIRMGHDPYGFIGKFQGFNGINKTPLLLASELFQTYRDNKQTQDAIAEAVVSMFESSNTFAVAKRLAGLLETLTIWKPDFSTRISSALEHNDQVNGSWGVPDKVAGLIAKWA